MDVICIFIPLEIYKQNILPYPFETLFWLIAQIIGGKIRFFVPPRSGTENAFQFL